MLSNGIHNPDMSLGELVSDLHSDGLKRKSRKPAHFSVFGGFIRQPVLGLRGYLMTFQGVC